MTWQATAAAEVCCRLGEGPWWDASRRRLVWVDISAGALHTFSASGGVARSQLGGRVGFVVGVGDGGFLVGTDAGLIALAENLEFAEHLATPPDLEDGGLRLNDGVCDPAGRVLCGSVAADGDRDGTLWCWSRRSGFSALVEGVGMSNGLAFSPDGRILYFVDTARGRIDRFAYDADAGFASCRETLCQVPREAGLPDGLAVDLEGCVWVAVWGAGQIWRLSPEGERIGTVQVAASRTSNCAFGGDACDRLFITTACEGGEDTELDRQGMPGALFVADLDLVGAPVFAAAI